MTDYLDDKDYCSWSSLIRTGDLFGADFLYHKIPEQLYPIDNGAFLRNTTEFHSVVTDCRTGAAEYLQVKDMFADVDAVRASASLPLVSRMVQINGTPYLDGGIVDPIPVVQALNDGCDKAVVILTRHRDYRKGKEFSVPLMRLKYRKYPALVQAIEKRPQTYNETLARLSVLEQEGRVFVIAPEEPLAIRRTEKDRDVLRKGYEAGASLARLQMSQLEKFISES